MCRNSGVRKGVAHASACGGGLQPAGRRTEARRCTLKRAPQRRAGLPGPALAILAAALLAPLSGCRYDMQDQPKAKTFRMSEFYDDRLSARPLVAGTVDQDHLDNDELLATGRVKGDFSTVFPFPITREILQRGQERFNIYCAPCHGRTGNGDGMIVRRGFRQPPSYHIDRLRKAPVGHFFDVITYGFGSMYDYADRINPRDRWAIIAYIRALQFSQNATINDVPEQDRPQFSAAAPNAQPGASK
jgi:hypothetical protein